MLRNTVRRDQYSKMNLKPLLQLLLILKGASQSRRREIKRTLRVDSVSLYSHPKFTFCRKGDIRTGAVKGRYVPEGDDHATAFGVRYREGVDSIPYEKAGPLFHK